MSEYGVVLTMQSSAILDTNFKLINFVFKVKAYHTLITLYLMITWPRIPPLNAHIGNNSLIYNYPNSIVYMSEPSHFQLQTIYFTIWKVGDYVLIIKFKLISESKHSYVNNDWHVVVGTLIHHAIGSCAFLP